MPFGYKLAILLFAMVFQIELFSAIAAAQSGIPISFSADFAETVSSSGQPTATGKLKAGPMGMRMEGKFETAAEPYMMIINFKKRMMWNIMPAEQLYFAAPFDFTGTSDEDMRRFGIGSPCPEPGSRATHLGSDTLQGRMTEKWRCESVTGETDVVWFDSRLRVPIREESNDGTIFELSNILEEPLPSELFQPPVDFTEFEIPMVLE